MPFFTSLDNLFNSTICLKIEQDQDLKVEENKVEAQISEEKPAVKFKINIKKPVKKKPTLKKKNPTP